MRSTIWSDGWNTSAGPCKNARRVDAREDGHSTAFGQTRCAGLRDGSAPGRRAGPQECCRSDLRGELHRIVQRAMPVQRPDWVSCRARVSSTCPGRTYTCGQAVGAGGRAFCSGDGLRRSRDRSTMNLAWAVSVNGEVWTRPYARLVLLPTAEALLH